MTELTWREAVPDDAAACIELRGKTRENAFTDAQLRDLGITVESWGDGIRDGLVSGRVCCANGFTSLFLGCSTDPTSRSYGFYRHLGWTPTGTLDAAGDEILTLRIARHA
ncbi:GNAT family N-acetyltransferase [Burkholderia cepacia]|uniref:GNAT family N-acetyltransferase n=1 Tax=Burkholderia cepacia TaxID=292 RepID=UPI00158AF7AD|nr:GNAT family N-acetyltransferase [Burkholderia cepacia]